jgi:hypothetical protein
LRIEAQKLEENDDIDMLPASARNAGSLCKSSGTEAGADTAK